MSNLFKSFFELGLIVKYNSRDCGMELSDLIDAGLSVERQITERDVDPDQLKMGIKVEMEHTSNPMMSKKIALDHLAEFPNYYTALEEMERKLSEEHGDK